MTTPPDPDRLFVYGTLLPGGPRWHFLQQFVDDEGVVDSVAGHLFDTGCGYPAAVFSHVVFGDVVFGDVVFGDVVFGDVVFSDAASLIHGRVFVLDVDQMDHALDVLDQVEGAADGQYRRVQVVSRSGSTAWAYAYGEGLVLTPIADGSWLGHNGQAQPPPLGYGHRMPITPDTKSWTWVLERACLDCGFDAADMEAHDVADAVRKQASTWTRLLAQPRVRDRPNDDQWSALEYGCHVRDVFRLFDLRLGRMLDEHEPRFANWDQDVTAVEDRYDEQDPAVVAVELRDAAEQFAERLSGVFGDQWSRVGLRSDGAVFTVESFALYLIHDPVHHVHDVEAGNESLAR